MIKIERFVCNPFQENTYVVSDESRECAIIDCGALYSAEQQAIKAYLDNNNLKPVRLLCTHGHVDHNFGNAFVKATYGLSPEVALADQWLMGQLAEQAQMFGCGGTVGADNPMPTHYLAPGEAIGFGRHRLTVLPTPGHTPGSVLFYCREEAVVFSGDTLFRMSIGRTDFERGSFDDIVRSLATVVATLPADTVVHTGHGPSTTIGDELRDNPYLRNLPTP